MKKLTYYRGIVSTIALAVFLFSLGGLEEASAKNEDPYLQPDETWISISGKVASAQPNSFELDYGDATVTVEMDDWDLYNEGELIKKGDNVIIYGMVDDDFYETTKIEANSVYVKNLGTYFYASGADESDLDVIYDYWGALDPFVVSKTYVRGTVTEVRDGEFSIDSGASEMTIDTSPLSYDPLDSDGYQVIDKGDYVSVFGYMEDDFWEARELKAESLVLLEND